MTRGRRVVCLMLLALVLTAGSALAEERYGVTSDGALLKPEPSSNASATAMYPAGVWMTVTGESGGWYTVESPDGAPGWMDVRQVQIPELSMANVGLVSGLSESAYVNLRERPHYQARVLATYHNGAPCLLLSHAGGWYHVRIGGVEGYLREEYVQPTMMAWADEAATVVTQGGGSAELRAGPGARYASVGSYPAGQYVIVLQRGLEWWFVSVDGQTGYLDANCLREGILTYTEISDASWTALHGAYAVVNNPVDTQLLNLRQSPSTLSTVLGQYSSGARLTLLNQGLEWCRVMNSAGEVGYMMTDYLLLEGVPDVPVMTVTHPDGTYVNLRSAPSVYLGAVEAQVPHGEQVTVLVPGSEWVKVDYEGTAGYMAANFLSE